MKHELNRQLVDAALHYDRDAMQRLLAAGADFNAVDPEEGTTPFSEALYNGVSQDCLHEMLQFGADPNVAPTIGGTPLIYAVWGLDFVLLQILLDRGADPNTPGFIDEDVTTPLDAVYDDFHTRETEPEKKVLEAMELLLKSRGAKCAYELRAHSVTHPDSVEPSEPPPC